MKIILSYKDINIDEIKVGDNFLAINDDDSFESYQFEKKDDIIYKFKVNIPNNYIEKFDGNKEYYYLNNFFYYENQLFLLNNSMMSCYDILAKEKKFREESDFLYSSSFFTKFFSDKYEDFLKKEKILSDDYKVKSGYTTIIDDNEFENNKQTEFIYSYISIKIHNSLLIIMSKYNITHNDLIQTYCVVNLKKIKTQFSNTFIDLNKKQKDDYFEYFAYSYISHNCLFLKNKHLFFDMIKNIKNDEIVNFCKLNILLLKLNRPYFNFNNMDNIVYKLRNNYKLNIDNPISLVYEFYGYKCYDINGSCAIVDQRTNEFIEISYNYNSGNKDITSKYLNEDNLIVKSLRSYHDYYTNQSHYKDLPVLFKDNDLNNENVIYKEEKHFIIENNGFKEFYRKFGQFLIKTSHNNEVHERYQLTLKLQEAE